MATDEQTEHRVKISEDQDGRAYAECTPCCWAADMGPDEGR